MEGGTWQVNGDDIQLFALGGCTVHIHIWQLDTELLVLCSVTNNFHLLEKEKKNTLWVLFSVMLFFKQLIIWEWKTPVIGYSRKCLFLNL